MDLGIANAGEIEGAVEHVSQARSKGEDTGLSQVLRDTGCLHPRFATVVERVVKSRLGIAPEEPAAPAAPASSPPPATPRTRASRGAATASADTDGQSDSIYKQAPRGEGYSVRSKEDVASAWAAYKKGKGPGGGTAARRGPGKGAVSPDEQEAPQGQPAQPNHPLPSASASAASPGADSQKAPGSGGLTAAIFASGPPGSSPPAPSPTGSIQPGKPLFPVGRKPKAGGAPPERLVPPTSGIGKQPGATAKRAYRPKRNRSIGATGVTQSIDIDSLKEELGITGKPKGRQGQQDDDLPEVEAVPKDEKQKEIAIRAFIKRVVPSMLHQHALEIVLKKRLSSISPTRLSEETGCKEREARRILEDWKGAGVARQDDPEIFQYMIIPSKPDLALIREFLTLWNDPEWHQKLLGWIIEAAG
jgi:hypothetical protein